MSADTGVPFWKRKSLAAMTPAEWESLCDGCGKCCLLKLQDAETDEISYTNVACRLLDSHSCRCKKYEARHRYVPDCVRLSARKVRELPWMPSTCAYRLLAEGKDLPDWHPLVSGSKDSVHAAGMSVRGRTVPEREAGELEDYICTWPA